MEKKGMMKGLALYVMAVIALGIQGCSKEDNPPLPSDPSLGEGAYTKVDLTKTRYVYGKDLEFNGLPAKLDNVVTDWDIQPEVTFKMTGEETATITLTLGEFDSNKIQGINDGAVSLPRLYPGAPAKMELPCSITVSADKTCYEFAGTKLSDEGKPNVKGTLYCNTESETLMRLDYILPEVDGSKYELNDGSGVSAGKKVVDKIKVESAAFTPPTASNGAGLEEVLSYLLEMPLFNASGQTPGLNGKLSVTDMQMTGDSYFHTSASDGKRLRRYVVYHEGKSELVASPSEYPEGITYASKDKIWLDPMSLIVSETGDAGDFQRSVAKVLYPYLSPGIDIVTEQTTMQYGDYAPQKKGTRASAVVASRFALGDAVSRALMIDAVLPCLNKAGIAEAASRQLAKKFGGTEADWLNVLKDMPRIIREASKIELYRIGN